MVMVFCFYETFGKLPMAQIFISLLLTIWLLMTLGCQEPSFVDETITRFRLNEYTQELTEYELLGIDRNKPISEDQISSALSQPRVEMTLHKGDRLLVIQSGAVMPDAQMLTLLKKQFDTKTLTGMSEYKRIKPEPDYMLLARLFIATAKEQNQTPYSGANQIGTTPSLVKPDYAQVMRFAAAKANIQTILVYWRFLESGIVNHQTKIVSWIPIAGSIIPDKTRYLRMRMKVCLIDVKSGQWELFTPKLCNDEPLTTTITRGSSNRQQVQKLMALAYGNMIEELLDRFCSKVNRFGNQPWNRALKQLWLSKSQSPMQ